MAEEETDLKQSQISNALEEMFKLLIESRLFKKAESIQTLWISLHAMDLIKKEPPHPIQNASYALRTIKDHMTRNLKARKLVVAWLGTIKNDHYKITFISQEKFDGLQFLSKYEPKQGSTEDRKAQEWIERLSMEVHSCTSDISRSDSLFVVLHCALQRQIEIIEKNTLDKTLASWESLKETLKAAVSSNKDNEILQRYFTRKGIQNKKTLEWKDLVENEAAVQSHLPFFVMGAADAFSTNVAVLCYPSKEEVIFYPLTPTERTIRIGLINKLQYDCIIPKDKEKDLADKVKVLDMQIEKLRNDIESTTNKINDLKEKEQRNEEEIATLEDDKERLEKLLAIKEEEKEKLLSKIDEEVEQRCQNCIRNMRQKYREQLLRKNPSE